MEYTRCVFLASLVLVYLARPISSATALIDIKGNEQDSVRGMWCPIWRNMICGSDGITYWNDCHFSASGEVKEGLRVVAPGACEAVDCEECLEEEKEDPGLEICGTNAQIFNSLCEFECHTDVYPLLSEVYDHCRRGFPTKEEWDNATSDVYKGVFDAYALKFVDVVKEYNFDTINIKKFGFNAEILNEHLTITCKKISIGDFSTIKEFDPILFYSYNDVYGKTKLLFEIPGLEIRVTRFKAVGPETKISGRLKLGIGKNTFELIADTRSSSDENFCPVVHALSLRLVDADDVTVTMKPALPPKAAQFPFDGLIKEKLIELINVVAAPRIVEKLSEIQCLEPQDPAKKLCFGFFQSRMCF